MYQLDYEEKKAGKSRCRKCSGGVLSARDASGKLHRFCFRCGNLSGDDVVSAKRYYAGKKKVAPRRNDAGHTDEYESYLASDAWKAKRELARSVLGYRCYFCGATESLDLHHVSYRSLGREVIRRDLRWLCHQHHRMVHELCARKKMTIRKATRYLKKNWETYGKTR